MSNETSRLKKGSVFLCLLGALFAALVLISSFVFDSGWTVMFLSMDLVVWALVMIVSREEKKRTGKGAKDVWQ